MPTSDIGIDLGTRNSLAYSTGKGLVLNEPSIVVYDKNTEKIRAIGEEARLMEGRITSDMEIIRPIRQGVIVDYTVTEKMLKYFISRAIGRRAFRKPRISTSEEIRVALKDATSQIVETVHGILEKTPPELAADIVDRGIVLTGGGALLHGMDTLIEQRTGVSTLTVQDAMSVVAVGTGKYAEVMARFDG